jgi:MFS family permease
MSRPIHFFSPIRLAVMSAFFMNGFLTATWIVHIPQIKQVHHLSDGALGVILWGAAIGLFAGMLSGNPLIGRFGSKNLTGLCAIVLSLAVGVPVLSPAPWVIFAGLLIYGFFNALLDISMNAQAAYVEKLAQRQLMSSFHGYWSIGGFCGGAFGGLLLRFAVAPAIHIGICAVVFVALAVWVWRQLPEIAEDRTHTGIQIALPGGVLLPLAIVCFISILTEGVVADWAGVLLRSQIGTDAATAAIPYSAFLFSMAIVRFVGDRMTERFGAVTTMAIGLGTAVAGLLLAVLVPALVASVVGFSLVGFGLGNAVPLLFSAAGKIGRPTVAYAITAVASAGYFGLFTGPALIGGLAQLIHLPNAFLVVTAGVISGLVIVLGPIRATFRSMEEGTLKAQGEIKSEVGSA